MSKEQEGKEAKSKRKFISLSNVSQYLFCTICQDIFADPYRISCGHTFCQDCIVKWKETQPRCPICRQFFSSESLQRDLIGSNMINELEVYCINPGCPWKNTLQNLNEHLLTCYFDPDRIPDYIKKIVCESKADQTPNNDDDTSSTNSLNFNTKVSLKARLYNKNKTLMETVFSKKKESGNKRDTLFDLLSQYDKN